MLQYFKTVLMKVSFNNAIFEKELKKALTVLVPHEVAELRVWCYAEFDSHKKILERTF